MAGAGYTHSQIATMLVEGCLAHIAGNVQGKMPIEPVSLTELERADRGLAPGGQALMYPIGTGSVGVDLNGPTATVWFGEGDYDRALEALDAALKKGFRVKQLKDDALPNPQTRRRLYEVDLGNSRVAAVSADYAQRGSSDKRFLVRIVAQVRK
jgi:hypothetical protein